MQISLRRPSSGVIKLLRIMKLTAIFLFVVCLQVSAKGYTQTVTLSMKGVPLEKVFSEINRQTGYYFVYSSDVTQKSKPITINVQNASLEETLNQCLAGLPYSYVIRDTTIVIRSKIEKKDTNQNTTNSLIDVRGRVTNEKGEPVEGVTVTLKGTKIATSTDANGEFSLNSVDKDAVLIFTSVNMETFELKISGKTDLAISLKTKIT